MTTISKPIMAVANKIADIKSTRLKIREEKEQTKLQKFIAKISLILHNLFTKGEFNIDLDDDNVNKVVLEIAVQCKQIIDQYNINPEIQLDSKPITVEEFPNIQIKFEINNNKLNVTLIENDEYYYFPQEQLLLSIDLNDQKKIIENLQDKISMIIEFRDKVKFYENLNKKIEVDYNNMTITIYNAIDQQASELVYFDEDCKLIVAPIVVFEEVNFEK